MNNPHRELEKEVEWIVKHFDFLDLTLESPKAHPSLVNVKKLKKIIGEKKVVGHTGWYLPIGSPLEEARLYAVQEFEECLGIFRKLGVKHVNVHFDSSMSGKRAVDLNIQTLADLVDLAGIYGISVMAENTGGMFSRPSVLEAVFRKIPGLLLHLDIGHANIGFKTNQTPALLKKFSEKIVHVHASDNNGAADEHLSLGKGNIRWDKMVSALKNSGYDGTITLEVFSSKKEGLRDAKKLQEMWSR